MRVISGTARGTRLVNLGSADIRPTLDRVKESIFNLIVHSKDFNFNLSDSIVLDLFSGSGSFGIECLSRGAKFASFVENYSPTLNVLEKNLNLISGNNYEIIDRNIFKKETYNYFTKSYDIIFIDPPFLENKIEEIILKALSGNDLCIPEVEKLLTARGEDFEAVCFSANDLRFGSELSY